jgi:transcriptional regulator with XRE-family HTH domain
MKKDLAKNLKYLCAERGSVAQACREMGIIQQQFGKYLNGTTMPSAYTLRKICNYFNLMETDILMSHEGFIAQTQIKNKRSEIAITNPLAGAFPGDLSKLRPLLGAYNIYYISPAWPGSIVIGATFLREQNRQITTRMVERGPAPIKGGLERSSYKGSIGYHGSRIFVIDFEKGHDGAIIETILYPPHRQHKKYLKGFGIGLSWRPRRTPFAGRIIWKKAENYTTAKDVLKKCGIYPEKSSKIDIVVRNFLLEKTDIQ